MLQGRSLKGRFATALLFVCALSSADDRCEPLQAGDGRSDNDVNLVFVPSNYGGDAAKFRRDAQRALSTMARYPAMGQGFRSRAIYIVDGGGEGPDNFCRFNCDGIQRLLCCDTRVAKELSGRCGLANRQTIVIQNDAQYGGAGYSSSDVATISTHPSSPEVLVHELGHSLFNLGDEYEYGFATDRAPNCESSEGCDKWADLIGAGLPNVGCATGYCGGGRYRASTDTVMKQLRLPFHPVNERIACCEYKNVTGRYPAFCSPYLSAGKGLDRFCGEHLASEQIYVANPVVFELEKDPTKSDPGAWRVTQRKTLGRGRFFRQEQVLGHGSGRLHLEVERAGELKSLRMPDDQHVEYFEEDGTIRQAPQRQPRQRITVVLEGGAASQGAHLRMNGRPVR